VMGQELSGRQKFMVVGYAVAGPCEILLGIVFLLSGASVRGLLAIAMGVFFIYSSYKTATSPPAPESDADFKKCPACGKFTRKANVCKHCGHDLTHSVSGAPPNNGQENPPTTSGAPATEAHERYTKVRCNHCQHAQAVPVNQATFSCEQCGAHLKRAAAPAESGW
jgi:ribosomal protein S27E/ribosomal protein L32